jgi:hypothetical protein
MTDEAFLSRWSRLKHQDDSRSAVPAAMPPITANREVEIVAPLPPLTAVDVADLDVDSDFAPFMSVRANAGIRRLALKKMFTDPHFNIVDGLDIYMGDYNLPSPVSAVMLATLQCGRAMMPATKVEAAASSDIPGHPNREQRQPERDE